MTESGYQLINQEKWYVAADPTYPKIGSRLFRSKKIDTAIRALLYLASDRSKMPHDLPDEEYMRPVKEVPKKPTQPTLEDTMKIVSALSLENERVNKEKLALQRQVSELRAQQGMDNEGLRERIAALEDERARNGYR